MLYNTKKWLLFVGFITFIVLLAAVITQSGILTLDSLQKHKDSLRVFVQNHFALSMLVYIGIYALYVCVSLPGAALLTLTGGFLFSAVYGTIFTLIGATAGATGAFLISRYFLRSWIQHKYAKRLRTVNAQLASQGAYYLLALRFMGFIPFFLINTLAGVTPVSLKTFIVTTALGIIPGSLVYSFAGQQLATLKSLKDIVSPSVLGAFMLLGALALLPVFFLRKTQKSNTVKEV